MPGDAGAIAQVRVDAWRTTYKGMIPDAYLAAMKVEDSAACGSACSIAASSTDERLRRATMKPASSASPPATCLREAKHGFDAELTAIYLRARRQRAGVGRRLVAAVGGRAAGAGRNRPRRPGSSPANRAARAFYERLGAELLVEQPFQWDGMDLVEVGYGWRNLDALAPAGQVAEKSDA